MGKFAKDPWGAGMMNQASYSPPSSYDILVHAEDGIGYRPVTRVGAHSHDEAARLYNPRKGGGLFFVRNRANGHVVAFNAAEVRRYEITRARSLVAH